MANAPESKRKNQPRDSRTQKSSELSGLNVDRLKRLSTAIQRDVEKNIYDGAVVIMARHGIIGLHKSFGFANRATNRACKIDDVFNILSVTKAFTDVTVLSLIEHGDLALTTRVAEIIPEFKGKNKDAVTVFQLLTHTAGSPPVLFPVEADLMGNLDVVIKAICDLDLVSVPGTAVSYSPLWGHALLGDIIRRLDSRKRTLREIFQNELFSPLGMKDTALGQRRDLRSRVIPIVAHDSSFGDMSGAEVEKHNRFITERAEIPWMGCVSTAYDLFRFAEMLRRGGEFEKARILSPATVRLATSIQTGTMINQYHAPVMIQHGMKLGPANIGLDFQVRGEGVELNSMGNFTSPSTFGKFGLGGTGFWVDPERGVTYVFLRSGLLEHFNDIANYQRLSDMAISAVT